MPRLLSSRTLVFCDSLPVFILVLKLPEEKNTWIEPNKCLKKFRFRFICRFCLFLCDHVFGGVHVKMGNNAGCVFKCFLLVLLLVLNCMFGFVSADFENSWTMYNEQPCCAGNQNHHVRHHRGKKKKKNNFACLFYSF